MPDSAGLPFDGTADFEAPNADSRPRKRQVASGTIPHNALCDLSLIRLWSPRRRRGHI
jgi:hypothetical protein